MEEKRNVTICFNSDEMYIVKYFQEKGKLSTEMKRILKDFVDNKNDNKNSDIEDILDTRLAKILSVVVGNGVPQLGGGLSAEMISQLNNMQNAQSPNSEKNEEVDEVDESDEFSLPPESIMNNFPFFSEDAD